MGSLLHTYTQSSKTQKIYYNIPIDKEVYKKEKRGIRMIKRLALMLFVLLTVFTTIALAETEMYKGFEIEYWAQSDSTVSPNTIVKMLKATELLLLTSGIEKGFTGQDTIFAVFKLEEIIDKPDIQEVQLMFYTNRVEESVMVLVGYTIKLTDSTQTSYKYHKVKGKYVAYDYRTNQYVKTQEEIEEEQERNRIPKQKDLPRGIIMC